MSIHSVVGDSAQGTNCVDIIPTVRIPIQQKATATRQNPTALGENQGKEGATEEIPMPSAKSRPTVGTEVITTIDILGHIPPA